jgi:ribonuclease HI
MGEFLLQFDGASRGNPGMGGAGAVILKNGEIFAQTWDYLGNCVTNNFAEYQGLILGLRLAEMKGIKTLTVQGDSKLAINQVQGLWQARNAEMIKQRNKVLEILGSFENVKFEHIPREKNSRADALANRAVDSHSQWYAEHTSTFSDLPRET